jgi:DNA-binding Xre family transcriptional regulator
MEIPVAVRFRLEEILEQANLSQLAVANKAGLSQVTVNAVARNRTKQVSLETLDKLCGALTKLLGRKVEPGELLERGR